MAIKSRINHSSANRHEVIQKLADELADKPYGPNVQEIPSSVEENSRITIVLPKKMLFMLEDEAMKNKRDGHELRSVSAIIRSCLQKYFS